jgi:type I restriction enzyme R subunit
MSDDLDQSEWQTRKTCIDARLRHTGRSVLPFKEAKPHSAYTRHAVEEFPTDNGPAAFALFVGGRPLGIIEAKKLSIGPQNVLTQAEGYARGVALSLFEFREFRAPFLYSTNGTITWHHGVRHSRSLLARDRRFPHLQALEERLGRDFDAACRKVKYELRPH